MNSGKVLKDLKDLKDSPRQLQLDAWKARRGVAVTLRKNGFKLDKIGLIMGVSKQRIHKILKYETEI
jgi:hypothetical protein